MIKAVAFDAYGTLFDVFSVAQVCDREYPGNGSAMSQIWRQKQLEYSWLRTLMGRYKPFWQVTEDALGYALDELRLQHDRETIRRMMETYHHLEVYPEVAEALELFRPAKLAILSNGNLEMLEPLVRNTGLDGHLDCILSVDELKMFKPRPEVYQLASDYFKVEKPEILFVSTNAWDVAGSKAFGFTVAWLNRLGKTPERLGAGPDYMATDLLELANLVSGK